jgi:thiol-disulfide isomerase/thioredoxin
MPGPAPNRRTAIYLILVAAGVFLLGGALIPLLVQGQQAALATAGVGRPPVVTSYPAPELSLTDLQGQAVSLADTRGRVVLVNNWATWCPPCKIEMPELQAYYQAHAADGFLVVAIESGEPAEVVEDFVQAFGLTFPVWLDPHGAALEAFANFNLPSSYVVDREGNVRMFWTGAIDAQTLEQYVTPFLER